MTLVVAEPTYGDEEHATINAVIAGVVMPGAVALAATPRHHAALLAAAPGAARPPAEIIDVLPPGGVTIRRMRMQWRGLAALVARHQATRLLLLSAGPETLFVARALVARHRQLQIHAVMHGNMADLPGWRSRDPRRRWIDLRAGLGIAHHPRIHLVVLEDFIASAAAAGGSGWRGIANPLTVWPHPTAAEEEPVASTWAPGPRLRLTVPGVANREKGFDDVLTLAAATPQHDWFVTGRLGSEYREGPPPMPAAPGRLSRGDYLRTLRGADYAVLMQQPAYDLIASGSVLDCATNRVPLIALRTPALTALFAPYGAPGYLVPDIEAARALLHSLALRDPATYARFQASLGALHRDRTAAALAPCIRTSLGLPV